MSLRTRPAVGALLRARGHALAAASLFAVLACEAALALVARGFGAAPLALASVPGALLLAARGRPVAAGVACALGATGLRLAMLGVPETCDQLAVSRAALEVIATGASPWGIAYAQSVPPGAPFPYGPLAAVVAPFGVPLEIVAMAGLLLLLAATQTLLTLAILGGATAWAELGTCGLNDHVPAVLLLAGLLLIARGRVSGALLIGLGAGIKPYLLAWAPGLAGLGGAALLLPLVLVAGLAWLPALAWDPRSWLASVEMARALHPRPANALNRPTLRLLALPAALVALRARSWDAAVLAGAAIFCIVLFLDRWASVGYLLVVVPPVAVIAERGLRSRIARY
ncbi:MAG: hypothetical protein ACKOTZ_10610 [Chloroflexota bacterium]